MFRQNYYSTVITPVNDTHLEVKIHIIHALKWRPLFNPLANPIVGIIHIICAWKFTDGPDAEAATWPGTGREGQTSEQQLFPCRCFSSPSSCSPSPPPPAPSLLFAMSIYFTLPHWDEGSWPAGSRVSCSRLETRVRLVMPVSHLCVSVMCEHVRV